MKQIFHLLFTYLKLFKSDPKKALELTNIYNFKRLFTAFSSESRSEVLTNADNFLKNITPINIVSSNHPTTHEIELIRENLDAEYYKNHYEVIDNPAKHYCEKGWKKGFNPRADFDTKYYLMSNPDVKSALLNPYYHYLAQGINEGRHALIPGGIKRRQLNKTKSIKTQEKGWKGHKAKKLTSVETLSTLIKDLPGKSILSLSHDNFKENAGGVQLCVSREFDQASSASYSYIHLSPLSPKLSLQLDESLDIELNMFIGTSKALEVRGLDAIEVLKHHGNLSAVAMHSILGFTDSFLMSLTDELKPDNWFFWMHDFSSCCVNFNLMRNGISFCGGPSLESSSCSVCSDYEGRKAYLPVIKKLFGKGKFRFICPSQSTMDVILNTFPEIENSLIIHPHLMLRDKTLQPYVPNKKIKIAFCGSAMFLKGWSFFIELANQLYGEIEFYHFSTVKEPYGFINHVMTTISDGKSQMTQNLLDNNIDFVFVGSLCSETFSYSAHEAISAGCYLLNLGRYGNIPYLINETQNIGNNYSTLFEMVEDVRQGKLQKKIEQRRNKGRELRDYKYSNFSLDLIN